MTELLQQAIAQIQQFQPNQQDTIAARFLAEFQDEQKWEPRFSTTTDDKLDHMALMVRQEIAKEETIRVAIDSANTLTSIIVNNPVGECKPESSGIQ